MKGKQPTTVKIDSKAAMEFTINDPQKPLELRSSKNPTGYLTYYIRTDYDIENNLAGRPIEEFDFTYVLHRLSKKIEKLKGRKKGGKK